eukprot:SM000029S10446  [mRNA]  locus=s29:269808:270562:+ [translate_table: standard]
MLILKLAVVVFIFNQHGSWQNFVLLSFAATLIYLYKKGVLPPLLRHLADGAQRALGMPAPPPAGVPRAPPAAAAPGQDMAAGGEQAAAAAADGQGPAPPAATAAAAGAAATGGGGAGIGVLKELQLLVVGFFASLLPGFQGPDAPLHPRLQRQEDGGGDGPPPADGAARLHLE